MKLIKGLLDYRTPWALPNVYLFTGNSTLKMNGAIVMGRGAAKMVRDSYLGIDRTFGHLIALEPDAHVIMHHMGNRQHLGWFKVKTHWSQPAKLELILASVLALTKIAEDYPIHQYHMNFPGIGNGKLSYDKVYSLVKTLPDNVLIYR